MKGRKSTSDMVNKPAKSPSEGLLFILLSLPADDSEELRWFTSSAAGAIPMKSSLAAAQLLSLLLLFL